MELSTTSHFVNDLGLDSLDTVEVVMAIEEVLAHSQALSSLLIMLERRSLVLKFLIRRRTKSSPVSNVWQFEWSHLSEPTFQLAKRLITYCPNLMVCSMTGVHASQSLIHHHSSLEEVGREGKWMMRETDELSVIIADL